MAPPQSPTTSKMNQEPVKGEEKRTSVGMGAEMSSGATTDTTGPQAQARTMAAIQSTPIVDALAATEKPPLPRYQKVHLVGFVAFACMFASGILSTTSVFKSSSECSKATSDLAPLLVVFIIFSIGSIYMLFNIKSNKDLFASSVVFMIYGVIIYSMQTYASHLFVGCSRDDSSDTKKNHATILSIGSVLLFLGQIAVLLFVFDVNALVAFAAGVVSHVVISLSTRAVPFHKLGPKCGPISKERKFECFREIGEAREVNERLENLAGRTDESGAPCENRVKYGLGSAITAAFFKRNGDPQDYFSDTSKLNQIQPDDVE